MHPLLDDVAAATRRLLTTVAELSDAEVREPSLFPGWTRGHVLAHVARNADGLRNLATWARTGVEAPMHASREARTADIERDAARPAEEHRRDLAASADALAEALSAIPTDRLDVTVRLLNGVELPARDIAWHRLKEVEIHHADLGAGYTFTDWPDTLVVRGLTETVERFSSRPGTPAVRLRATDDAGEWLLGDEPHVPVAGGSRRALFAWLTGRTRGEGLTVAPAGPFPVLPAWP